MKTNITREQFFTILDAAACLEATANKDLGSGDWLDFPALIDTAVELRKLANDLFPDDEEETNNSKLPIHEAFGFSPEEGP